MREPSGPSAITCHGFECGKRPDDNDGDGFKNEEDNCPDTWNPRQLGADECESP